MAERVEGPDLTALVRRGLRDGARLRHLALEACAEDIVAIGEAVAERLANGGSVLTFGNGGSAADAQHFAAELVGRFTVDRPPLSAVALSSDPSVLTALANDFGFANVFARQIQALGRAGDVAMAVSTSGRSENVLAGVAAARERGLRTFALTRSGSPLARDVERSIAIPAVDTARIQELHVTALHLVCEIVDVLLTGHIDESTDANGHPKQLGWDALLHLREAWRGRQRTVVWTNGAFDLLHAGHVRALEAAKALGEVLVVGVNSDDAVRALKGPDRPILPLADRVAVVAALEAVDHVVVLDAITPEHALAALQPDVHCKGADYAPGGKGMPEMEIVRGYGGRIEYTALVPDISTSDIIDRVRGLGRDGTRGQ